MRKEGVVNVRRDRSALDDVAPESQPVTAVTDGPIVRLSLTLMVNIDFLI